MSKIMRNRLRRRVIVTMKDGAAFRGVLFSEDARALVLRNVEHIAVIPGAPTQPVDGEVVLLLVDVAYLQIP